MKSTANFLTIVFLLSLFTFNSYALTDSKEEMPSASGNETPRIEDGNLIVTVEDIISVKFYNFVIAGLHTCPPVEIEFTRLKPADLYYQTGQYGKMFLFLGDKLLFDPAIPIKHPISSILPDDLCLYYIAFALTFNKYYQIDNIAVL